MSCESFWVDEGASWSVAHRSWGNFVSGLRSDPSMPLYYVLLHFWLKLGDGEAFLRSLSVVFGVASVPLTYLVAKELLGAKAAATAALLLTINEFVVYYSQETRGYSLTLFLVIASSYLAVRALRNPSRKAWIAYVASALVAVASHAFALFVVLAHLATFVATRRVSWRRIAIAVSMVSLSALILLVGPLGDALRHNRFSWIARIGPAQALGPLGALTGQGKGWFVVPYLALAALGAWTLARRLRTTTVDDRWRIVLVLAWLFVPLVGSLVASIAVPMFVARYLIVVVPALSMAVAAGTTSVERPAFYFVTLGVVLFIGTQALNVYYRTPQKEEWRLATASILERAKPSDSIILYHPNGANPYAYYVELDGATDTAPHMLWPLEDPRSERLLRLPTSYIEEQIDDLDGRLWFVRAYEFIHEGTTATAEEIQDLVDARMDEVKVTQFSGGIRVGLYKGRD